MAERIPREEKLRRVHGVGALFSTAYGNVGSSIYYALGLVAGFALGLTPLTFLIAGLIFLCTAATYVEATVMYPEAGGSSSFARHAFNEVVSFVAGWGQMLNYVITAAISAFFVPHYLTVFWEPLGEAPADAIFAIALLAALATLNVVGTRESARVNLVLAIGDLLTQILLVGVGLALVLNPDVLVSNVELGVAPTWSDFAVGIAVGMIAYTGIETISNMAEEAQRPIARTISRGTGAVVFAVLVLYLLLPVVALSAMPVTEGANGEYTTELGTRYADSPMLGIVNNLGLEAAITDALRVYVGLLAAVILVVAANAALIGVSRLTFSMGHYRQLPERLRQLHPRFGTPHVAIVAFAATAALTILPGEPDFLATMYSFGAMLSFTVAHAAVLSLRRSRPDQPREWKPPLNIGLAGRSYPLTGILGGLGTFAAWIVVMALNLTTLAAGATWMALGVVLYIAYRRRHGLPLAETRQVASLEPLGVTEVEYESVLLVFEDDPFSEEIMAMVNRLAARRRRGIHVLSLVNVPLAMPLDAPLRDKEAEAQSKIERAKLLAGRRVSGRIRRVRPGEAGAAIVGEARTIRARAIVMQLRYRNGRPLYGKTLQYVLAKRPARVIVVAAPGEGTGAPVTVGAASGRA